MFHVFFEISQRLTKHRKDGGLPPPPMSSSADPSIFPVVVMVALAAGLVVMWFIF